MRVPRLLAPLLALATLCAGCTHYQYDIVRPPDLQQRIPDDWRTVPTGPAEFRLRTYDNHLVIQVFNRTDGPIKVLGDQSYTVTPTGRSIPMQSQTIAPNAYVKFILPPVPTVIRSTGPSIGFGVGYSYVGPYYRHYPYYYPYAAYSPYWYNPYWYDPYYAGPQYFYIEDADTYWEWEGESDATLHLVFDQAGKTFDRTFVFHRVKI